MNIKQISDNCIIYSDDEKEILFSYEKAIVRKIGESIALDSRYWNFSKTTGKHRGIFLGEGIAETRRKIDAGIYSLVDLNEGR
jgi:uncharacterized protein affecting Mg2+/Co2+ transport